MPIKIGIIGTNSSGKTTLCYELLAALKKDGALAVGVVDQDRNYTFPKERSDTDKTIWHGYIGNQIAEEVMASTKGEIVICDRTPLDTYAYYEILFGYNDSLSRYVYEWVKSYDFIYLTDPKPYQNDPMRQHDEAFRDAVHAKLLKLIREFPIYSETGLTRKSFINSIVFRARNERNKYA